MIIGENPITITSLNDFIFCPVSICFHSLESDVEKLTYQDHYQYSVYEIENSERILNNIITDLNNKYIKQFDQYDSVYIFHMSPSCKITKYGYAKNEDNDLIILG